jgi:predicted nuclease of predicted toxin-antitoxin system
VRFLVDANLPRSLSNALSAAGHDVAFGRDIDLAAARDEQIAAHAKAAGAALITRDLDFADIRQYPPNEYFGIVVLRMPDDSIAADIVKTMLAFTRDATLLGAIAGRLAIVEMDNVRLRPPLGFG